MQYDFFSSRLQNNMKLISIFISLLTPFFVFSQFNVTCLNLTDTTKNIFYIGIDNQIRVSTTNNFNKYQIEVEGAGGSLTKIDLNEYIVRVSALQTCYLTIKQNGKQVFFKEFNVYKIGNAVATLSGIRDTTVSRNRILLNPFLSIVIPNCYLQVNSRVVAFNATFINNGDSIPTIANGNFLSQEQISLVKGADPGSKIYFDRVRAAGPDDLRGYSPPFWIKIE